MLDWREFQECCGEYQGDHGALVVEKKCGGRGGESGRPGGVYCFRAPLLPLEVGSLGVGWKPLLSKL